MAEHLKILSGEVHEIITWSDAAGDSGCAALLDENGRRTFDLGEATHLLLVSRHGGHRVQPIDAVVNVVHHDDQLITSLPNVGN